MNISKRTIAISGTRPPRPGATPDAFAEYEALCDDVERVMRMATWDWYRVTVLSGGAVGIDRVVENWCVNGQRDRDNIDLSVHRPNYEKYGKRAPLLRNDQMVDMADTIIAWPSSWSRGTEYTIRYAKSLGKAVRVRRFSKVLGVHDD